MLNWITKEFTCSKEFNYLALFGPGIGAGLRKQDLELKKKMDDAIRLVNSSGEFKTIQAKYFDFDLTACAASYKYC